ncbi:MAG: aldehyde dehydrogenase family protein [Myxococcota bacterium]|nr:aldehyde dehydrogenase family protein [Myxococcota bacterium]
MLKSSYPFYLANTPQEPNTDLVVLDKSNAEPATEAALASAEDLETAIAAAVSAVPAMRALPLHTRQAILRHCADQIEARAEEFAKVLVIEAGKPILQARAEVERAQVTFRVAAEEAARSMGEVMDLGNSPATAGAIGMTRRVGLGPVALITPFNFPLNLVAHKVAPAIAAGCPFVLKPSERTPISALMLGEILAETELPEGAFSILPMDVEDAQALVTDDRFKLLSFTGSDKVGWELKAKAGRKKVMLELGGNAAVIVDKDADLDEAVARVVEGAFSYAGQSCISVQRIYVHQQAYSAFRDKLVGAARRLEVGDPSDEDNFVGPVIDEDAAARIEDWVQDAVIRGATILCGGDRDGLYLTPTVLENVRKKALLHKEEAFGPVASIIPFKDYEVALAEVDDGRFGLQVGVFTESLESAMSAWEQLNVGAVIVGDVPTWRADAMPYGGTKDSGTGREGLRYAIDEMSELRLLVMRR